MKNPEQYSLTSRDPCQSSNKFVESFEAPQSPKRTISHTSHYSMPLPPPSSPPPVSLPPPTPPPQPLLRRPYQPLLPRASSTLSRAAPSTFPSSTLPHSPPPTRNVPAIYTTSPTPASSHFPPPPPPSLPPSSRPSFKPSRRAPTPPKRKHLFTRHASSTSSGPSSPTSLSSRVSSGTRSTERSWRESTISALERVVTSGGGQESDAKEKGNGRVKISGPVEGSFVHVDGAFVDGRPFVFGDAGDGEGGIGRAT
jgi:hypothetical protein